MPLIQLIHNSSSIKIILASRQGGRRGVGDEEHNNNGLGLGRPSMFNSFLASPGIHYSANHESKGLTDYPPSWIFCDNSFNVMRQGGVTCT